MLDRRIKYTIAVSIFMISLLAKAAPQTPYIEPVKSTMGGMMDTLVIHEDEESKVYLFNCSIISAAVKYLGDSPICTQNISCGRGETATHAIVEHSNIEITANCAIPSAAAGCRSQTWQKCTMDKSLPDELDESCFSENPGATKPGCPKVKSQGSTQQAGEGSR